MFQIILNPSLEVVVSFPPVFQIVGKWDFCNFSGTILAIIFLSSHKLSGLFHIPSPSEFLVYLEA